MSDIRVPPRFDGINFPIWKIKMSIFLKSLGRNVYLAIENKYIEPKEFDAKADVAYEANAKATYALMQSLNEDDLSRVINCESAHSIWQTLITTHEGTSQVKRAKIDLLMSEYENFVMYENESIDMMLTRFNNICNGLVSLGEKLTNDQKVRKIIRSLPKTWEVKATTLKELNDAKEMDFMVFMGNLKTHEMEMTAREQREPPKKINVQNPALKANHYKKEVSSDEETSSSEDEDLDDIIRQVRKFICRDKKKYKKKKKEIVGPCYKCGKEGHLRPDCPLLQSGSSSKEKSKKAWKKQSKKALKGTWDDSSSSEFESESDKSKGENATLAFMAFEDSDDEVQSNSSSLESKIPYNLLEEAFSNLMDSYKNLKSKFVILKKENETYASRFDAISNEKEKALNAFHKVKNDFDEFKSSHVCEISSNIDFNEEMKFLKGRVDCLSTTLSDCAFNTRKLENMFIKKHGSKSVAKQVLRAHEHKRIFQCTFCGRNGHLAKFCYDDPNVGFPRVPRTNGGRPSMVWVPKDQRFSSHLWD